MPDPREAVYDVLLAKKARADAAREWLDAEREAWAEYESANAVANSSYRPDGHNAR